MTSCRNSVGAMWRHAPPLAQSIHCLCAFGLVLAQQFMLAHLMMQPGLDQQTDMLAHDLDIIFDSNSLLQRNLPRNLTAHYRIPIEALRPALDNGAITVRLVPLLVNHQLYGMPLEFVNYFLALLVLSIVWPNVFWRSNKSFSLIFSFHLLLHLINAILSYVAWSLLFRVHIIGVRAFLGIQRMPFLMPHSPCILGIYLTSITVAYLASICIYAYGYNKFYLSLVSRSHTLGKAMNNNNGTIGLKRSNSIEQSMTRSVIQANAASNLCCEGYGPHIAAIIMLILMVTLKAPLMYDLMVLYQSQKKHVLFAAIVADVVFLFWWIILWLALTLKRDWPFNVAPTMAELILLIRAKKFASDDGTISHRSASVTTHKRNLQDSIDTINSSAMILITNDDAYYTVDLNTKYTILRNANKLGMIPHSMVSEINGDEYWLNQSTTMPVNDASGMTRRNNGTIENAETSRLLDSHAYSVHRDDLNIAPNYQTVDRDDEQTYGDSIYSNQKTPQHSHYSIQRQSTPYAIESYRQGVSTFGTLPRGTSQQPSNYGDTASLMRQAQLNQIHQQQYSTLGGQVYARPTPPQARVITMSPTSNVGSGRSSTLANRRNSPTFAQQHYTTPPYGNARE